MSWEDPLVVWHDQQKIGVVNSWLLAALIFFLPVSTSISTIVALLIVLLWLIEGNLGDKFKELMGNRLVVAVLAYAGLFVLGLLWTDNLDWGLKQTAKQWKLLLLLPLCTIVRREHYKRYLGAFLAAMTFSAVLSFLIWLEIIHLEGVLPQYPVPFNSHISYNPLLALALYFLLHILVFGRPKAKQLAVLLPAGLIMTGSMFITTGRSGQAAFFVLLFLLILQYFRKHILFGICIAAIAVPALLLTAYHTGPGFRLRTDEAISDLKAYRYKPDTSTAQRLTFAVNSIDMLANSPWFGVGTGDFPAEYKKINEKNSPSFATIDDPHNHYLLIFTQFGIFGLIPFLGIFAVQFLKAFTQKDALEDFRLALPIFYLTIMLGGTYLLGHELALCFAVTGALFFGNPTQQIGAVSPKQKPATPLAQTFEAPHSRFRQNTRSAVFQGIVINRWAGGKRQEKPRMDKGELLSRL
jgi:O-antigen ligase